jgi:hypothetical protein
MGHNRHTLDPCAAWKGQVGSACKLLRWVCKLVLLWEGWTKQLDDDGLGLHLVRSAAAWRGGYGATRIGRGGGNGWGASRTRLSGSGLLAKMGDRER